MSAEGKAQWLKLTVVQLKGALTMRGLDTDGKKSELVERLTEYELKKEKEKEEEAKKAAEAKEKKETEGEGKVNGEEKTETADADENKKNGKEEDDDTYSLPKGKFISTYSSATALFTVLITPFYDEFFSSASFTEHIKKVKTFKLHKIWNGTSAAELRFGTVGEGEEAFIALKNELSSIDVDVYHPGFRANFNQTTLRNEEFQTIFEGMGADDSSFERLVILDKLPEGTTDTKLAELIPEAIEYVDLGFHEESQGCMLVVFDTKKACTEWMEKHKDDFKIEDTKVRCYFFNPKDRKGNARRAAQKRKEKAEGKSEEKAPVKLSTEDRLAKVKEWNAFLTSRNVLQDRDDVTGYDKLKEEKRITEGMTRLSRELLDDAKMKVAAKEKLPEPVDQMTAPVKKLVSKDDESKPRASGDAPKAPARTEGHQNRGTHQRGRGGLRPMGSRGGTQHRGGQSQRGGQPQRGGQLQRGNQMRRGVGQRGGRGMLNTRRDVTGPMNKNLMRKRPSIGPTRSVDRQGSYYDDAPSKKRPRQQSPYRGSAPMNNPPMNRNMNMGGGGGYNNPQEQQLQGLTSMLSNKMRELERMQQQTLAVQSQLSQNIRMSDNLNRNDSYSSNSMLNTAPSQSYSSIGFSSQSSYGGGSSGYGSSNYGSSSLGSSSMGGSAYSNLSSSMGSNYGSSSSSNFMSSNQPSQSMSSSWSNTGYGGGSSSMSGGKGNYGGGRQNYGGGNQQRRSGGGGRGGGMRRDQNRRR